MLVKIVTGVILAAVALGGILLAPAWILAPVLALVFLGALDEFVRLPGPGVMRVSDRVVTALAGAALLAVAVAAPDARVFPWMVTALSVGLLAVMLAVLANPLGPDDMPRAGLRAAHCLGGLGYVGLLSAVALQLVREGDAGRYVILVAGLVTWLNDTMAYFGGKALGRRKMYPAVSPNKTWEGSVSGMFGSVGGALLAWALLMPDSPVLPVVGFALVGGALGQAGDLAESVFKRAYGVKDSGAFLPGHGGFLDRVDAFLFVGPVAWFWYFQWFPL